MEELTQDITIQPVFSDPIPPNPIDVAAYKLYRSLGLFRGIARVPIDPKMGINCGGETVDSGGRRIDWDGFCLEQWHEGWAVFANIFIWIVVIVVVVLILKRKLFSKHKSKTK